MKPNKTIRIQQQLISEKGVMVSFITYPVLMLLFMLSIGAFIASVNGNNLAKIHYNLLEAEYNALTGIEYASIEVKKQGFAGQSFLTHWVDPDNNDKLTPLENTDQLQPVLEEATGVEIFDEDGEVTYGLNDTDGNEIFRVKVYQIEGEVYILTKGTRKGQSRLFVSKLSGTSLYEYLAFFPGDISFGWSSWDAQGSKLHANGKIGFYGDAIFSNVREFSTPNKMYWRFYQYVFPGEENSYRTRRAPFYYPQGFDKDNPPLNYTMGSYLNILDGHFTGQRGVLHMWDPDFEGSGTGKFIYWDTESGNLSGTYPPISPWGYTGATFTFKDDLGADVVVSWATSANLPLEGEYRYRADGNYRDIYAEKDVNCDPGIGGNCATTDPIGNNAQFMHHNPYINGYHIPPTFNATYKQKKYLGASHAEEIDIDLTDSKYHADQWDAFINSFPVQYDEVADPYTVLGLGPNEAEGLDGVVKAGERNGAYYIVPPDVPISSLTSEAENTEQGMVIRAGDENITIIINGNEVTESIVFANEDNSTLEVTCDDSVNRTILRQETFINHQSGLPNKVVEVDMGEMMACEGIDADKNWLPTNGIVYAEGIGLSVKNAQKLPEGGITWVVQGNLLLKGNYNTDADWQPSGAIVSNMSYLVSDNFTYPEYLPYSHQHVNAPFAYSYDGTNTIPEGYDYVNGYNWLYRYDPDAPQEDPNKKMTNRAGGPGDPDAYYYNISLIGAYAYNPQFLELWNYYTDPGTDAIPPDSGDWKSINAVVTGAFVKLTDEFPLYGTLDWVNTRECGQVGRYGERAIEFIDIDGTIPFNDTNYVCRSGEAEAAGPTVSLLARNAEEDKAYEKNYVVDIIRPPGDLIGRFQTVLLELPVTNQNWTYHATDYFESPSSPG